MLPGAGLYLPDTLHKHTSTPSERTEPPLVKRKYFERKSTTTQDKGTGRMSMTLSRKSSDDVTRVFSSLSTVFEYVDFVATYGKPSSDSEVFINLVRHVRHDVTEASRLYHSQPVTEYFESWPDKKTWVDKTLLDIQQALNDIGIYMETVRVSGDDDGPAGLRRKFEWVLSHQKKLISKQQYLTTCHQSLMTAVNMMLAAEMNATFAGHDPVYEAPVRPWVKDKGNEVMRSPYSRQRWRSSQRNVSSVPNITVSEAEVDKVHKFEAQSINSLPVELPGSTPDDIPDPDNWDLYSSPRKPRSASMSAVTTNPITAQVSAEKEVVPPSNPQIIEPPLHQTPLTQQSSNSPLMRRSFDQVRPPLSSLHSDPRASLDQPQPRPHSDQLRPRTSFDQNHTLPTLNEKPLERYDSNASVSVTEASTVPLTTMRYRPKAVHVKKLPPKHRSLPSALPSLDSQTSLMDDLSRWVLPASARESFQSYETSTTSTSVASSPTLPDTPASVPAILDISSPIVAEPDSTASTPSSVPSTHVALSSADAPTPPSQMAPRPRPPIPRVNPELINPTNTLPSPHSTSPSAKQPASPLRDPPPPPVPHVDAGPTNSKKTPSIADTLSPTDDNTSNLPSRSPPSPPKPHVDISGHDSTVRPPLAHVSSSPKANVPASPSRPPPALPETHVDTNVENSKPVDLVSNDSIDKVPESLPSENTSQQLEKSASATTNPEDQSNNATTALPPAIEDTEPKNSSKENDVKVAEQKPTPVELPTASTPTSSNPPHQIEAKNSEPVKPMTAQARRRLAQARRMQNAFGAD